jgi:hypothetical protein
VVTGAGRRPVPSSVGPTCSGAGGGATGPKTGVGAGRGGELAPAGSSAQPTPAPSSSTGVPSTTARRRQYVSRVGRARTPAV